MGSDPSVLRCTCTSNSICKSFHLLNFPSDVRFGITFSLFQFLVRHLDIADNREAPSIYSLTRPPTKNSVRREMCDHTPLRPSASSFKNGDLRFRCRCWLARAGKAVDGWLVMKEAYFWLLILGLGKREEGWTASMGEIIQVQSDATLLCFCISLVRCPNFCFAKLVRIALRIGIGEVEHWTAQVNEYCVRI